MIWQNKYSDNLTGGQSVLQLQVTAGVQSLSDRVTLATLCVEANRSKRRRQHADTKSETLGLQSLQTRAVSKTRNCCLKHSESPPAFCSKDALFFHDSMTSWPRGHPVRFKHLPTDHWSQMKTKVRQNKLIESSTWSCSWCLFLFGPAGAQLSLTGSSWIHQVHGFVLLLPLLTSHYRSESKIHTLKPLWNVNFKAL